MSIKTTYAVTRDFAIEVIQAKLETLNDRQLSNILEETIHNGLFNFTIVTEEEMDQVRMEADFYLDDPSNLPEYNEAY